MVKHYLKTAWRNLTRQGIFSFINISGLALSLTAVWLIALYVADELSFDRYHEKADRIYRVVTHGRWDDQKFDITGTSGLAAQALKNTFSEVEDVVRLNGQGGSMLEYENNKLKQSGIYYTDPSFFTVFTHHFLSGNVHALEKPNSIVLTKSLAAKLFSDINTAVNKTVYIDKTPLTVTGVIDDVPANSHFTFNAVRTFATDYKGDWGAIDIFTYILLKKGADINKLRAKMPAFVTKYLLLKGLNIRFILELQALTAIHLHSHLDYEMGENRDIKYIYVLSIVGLLIVGIALINYVNITTARASVRLREVAVRKIIGSGRSHLMSLFLTESMIIILAAAIISVALVAVLMPLLNEVTTKQLAIWHFGVGRTILSMLGVTFVLGLIGGFYPAFFLSRFNTIPALKNQLGDVKGQSLFRKSLVTFQFAVTVVMITASLVIYLQLNYVRNTDLGFNKNQVLTFYLDSREMKEKVPALRQALLQNPMVKAVASANNLMGNFNEVGLMDYAIEKNGVLQQYHNFAHSTTVDADFIPALQMGLAEGRNFSKEIPSDSEAVIVNQAFCRKHGWSSGIGKRISRGADSTGKIHFANIIGVVKDFHLYSLQHRIEPMIMSLSRSAAERGNIYARLDEHHLTAALAFVKQTFKKIDPSAPFDYRFLDENYAKQYQSEERQAQALLGFTMLTIFIACLGLFGLITFTVGKRVKEIGIRKVLGASVTSVVALLTESLLKVVLISLFVAIPVSWFVMNKWLQQFAYRIDLSWRIFCLAGIISLVLAILTLSLQAIKAAIANPVKSLRTE